MSNATTATRATASAAKSVAPTITSARSTLLQRQCDCGAHAAGGECEDCKKKKGLLSRKAAGPAPAAPSHLVADALRSPGQALDPDTRAFMESRFQHDFSAVRVHTDARAADSARALQARAWAWGANVAFATGAYAPQTPAGRRLLAHELTHVVQQEQAPTSVPGPDSDLNVSEPDDASEREADRVADHVADSSALVVRSQAAPDVIHRDWDDLSKGEKAGVIVGSVVGAVGLVAFFAWLANRKGPEDIDKEGECGPRQNQVIVPVLNRAKQWAVRAVGRLRAYRARPRDPANQIVDLALKRRFRSTDPSVVEKVERVIVRTHATLWRISSDDNNRHCHTTKEPLCNNNGRVLAFTSHGVDQIDFCQSFFKKDESTAAETVIHEVTHTLVGGARILDRGYESERRFGGGSEPNRLTTDENLTNAESYAEFVADLATGEVFGIAPPADILECPDDWKDVVKESLSLAQRANTNLLVKLSQTDQPPQSRLDQKFREQGVRGNTPNAALVSKALLAVLEKLTGPIRIVCNTDAARHCGDGDVEWDDQAESPSITLCASWKARPPRAQTASILAALYGWIGKIENRAWRRALAEIAIDMGTDPQFAPAPHDEVFGSPAWTPDSLGVRYIPMYPLSRQPFYVETRTIHMRQSADMPTYTQTDCHKPTLTLSFVPQFFIDAVNVPRPGPYTRPRFWVKYSHPSREWEAADTNVVPPDDPGTPVPTFLSKRAHRVTFDANGTFAIEIGLHDPDTDTTRKYHDEITVTPVIECPDAISGADPAAPPRPDAISGADPAPPPRPDAISGADPAAPPRPDAISGAGPAASPRPDAISGADSAAQGTTPVRVQRAPDNVGREETSQGTIGLAISAKPWSKHAEEQSQ